MTDDSKRYLVRDLHADKTSQASAEVFAGDALGALDVYAKDQGYTGYDRDSYDADDFIVRDTPERAVVVFENTELEAIRA